MGTKYAFRNIKKNIIFTLLILIQLIISFFAINNSLEMNLLLAAENNKIKHFFAYDNIYKINFDAMNLKGEDLENISEIFNEFENSEEIEMYNNILSPGVKVNSKEIIDVMHLDDIHKYEFLLENNEILNKEVLDNQNVILGKDLKALFKIGDKIKFDEMEFTVAGFLKESSMIPGLVDTNGVDYKSLDSMILSSTKYLPSKFLGFSKPTFNYFGFKDGVSKDRRVEIFNDMKLKFQNINYITNIISINNIIEEIRNEYEQRYKISTLVSILVICASFVTLAISLLDSIYKRMKEFSIYIFSGSTMNDIIKCIFIEICSIGMLALNCFIMLEIYFKHYINVNNLFVIVGIMMIFILTSMIFPIKKLKSLSIRELLNEVF